MRIATDQIINISGTLVTTLSEVINIEQMWFFSIQFVWTGSPVGLVGLQASNDGVNFSPINGISDQAVSGSAGNYLFNIADAGYAYIQAYYTQTSGTGTVTAVYNAKGV